MKLFTPLKIGNFETENRLAKSAMVEGRCNRDGFPDDSLYDLYRTWSKGGIGLIVTGMAHIRKHHTFTGKEIGIYSNENILPLEKLTKVIKQNGSRAVIQIAHAPPQGPRKLMQELKANKGPSTRLNKVTFLLDKKMNNEEILEIIHDFAKAAQRAHWAGFDAVEIHAGHGYFLSQFLSPYYNTRNDKWGGSVEKRANILVEILKQIKSLEPRLNVGFKLNAFDGFKSGIKPIDALETAKILEKNGAAFIEVTAGVGESAFGFRTARGNIPWDLTKELVKKEMPIPDPFHPLVLPVVKQVMKMVAKQVAFEPCYNLDYSKYFAEKLNIPVIAVGGIRSLNDSERILNETKISMVSLARPFLLEPDLIHKWKKGLSNKAQCGNCNKCFLGITLGNELNCIRSAKLNL